MTISVGNGNHKGTKDYSIALLLIRILLLESVREFIVGAWRCATSFQWTLYEYGPYYLEFGDIKTDHDPSQQYVPSRTLSSFLTSQPGVLSFGSLVFLTSLFYLKLMPLLILTTSCILTILAVAVWEIQLNLFFFPLVLTLAYTHTWEVKISQRVHVHGCLDPQLPHKLLPISSFFDVVLLNSPSLALQKKFMPLGHPESSYLALSLILKTPSHLNKGQFQIFLVVGRPIFHLLREKESSRLNENEN